MPTREKRAWCYLSPKDEGILEKLWSEYGGRLKEPMLLTVLVSAALRAVEETGYKLPARLTAESLSADGGAGMNEDGNPPKGKRGSPKKGLGPSN